MKMIRFLVNSRDLQRPDFLKSDHYWRIQNYRRALSFFDQSGLLEDQLPDTILE